ncbi:MAG: GxxExxY protein [Flavobacterium sp.]|jgi:GxxExxY protein|uniref:GxxExxY protein n=1 Tax=Flavobacterium sp. TaxID=239 RepID=UPI0029741D0E|nr:GxxExxY protein [Flavobacterium sp.]TAF08540.1 MAG: GxxExxY protein [Flavobacteriia bacterium]WRH73162.1 MAG: GxxExxY protein [Flavobacterium sp.]
MTQKYLDELTFKVIGAAIEVHKNMGSGLLESVYQQCIIEELTNRNINFVSEFKVPVVYKGKELDIEFRCDLFVENCLIVELKSVSEIKPIHDAQVLNYMNLLKVPKGIIINFNCFNIFREGQKTFVNEYFKKLEKE